MYKPFFSSHPLLVKWLSSPVFSEMFLCQIGCNNYHKQIVKTHCDSFIGIFFLKKELFLSKKKSNISDTDLQEEKANCKNMVINK